MGCFLELLLSPLPRLVSLLHWGCRSVALMKIAGDGRFATAPGITNEESAKTWVSVWRTSVRLVGSTQTVLRLQAEPPVSLAHCPHFRLAIAKLGGAQNATSTQTALEGPASRAIVFEIFKKSPLGLKQEQERYPVGDDPVDCF